METRRSFIKKSALSGIAGIVATGSAPAFAQDMKMLKLGQIGQGSHGFTGRFKNPPAKFKDIIKCKPYAVWDDIPEVADGMKGNTYEKVMRDPEDVVRECDAILVMHADYRKVAELAEPALKAGKPVFINRPFTGTIADAEKVVKLAREYNAPLMSASSLEFQPELTDIKKFAKEKGPLRSYMAYCPEPYFTWMFPHVINFSHAALGGGIDSAYFSGDYIIEMGNITIQGGKFVDPKRPYGSAVSLLKYKSRDGEPPIIGMNHIGQAPGTYNIYVYAYEESKNFVCGGELNAARIFEAMFLAQNEFFITGKPPRPYEAILEQHRALVATNKSRLTGKAVKLDSLKGGDSLPYHDSIRNYVTKRFI
ncbi:Gfo/Idh/MocA family oxidoreductase [Candidatus Latescibacterota bacterium]